MFQLVIHGRGGQGAKTMALLLAEAAIEAGKNAQAYPDFGPERTGAPIRSFLRVDNEPIVTHEPITEPDAVVVLDDSLLNVADVKDSLKESPLLIINSSKEAAELQKETGFQGKIYPIDASEIIADSTFQIHPTTPIIGKLIKATDIIPLEKIKRTYELKFEEKIGEKATQETQRILDSAYHEL